MRDRANTESAAARRLPASSRGGIDFVALMGPVARELLGHPNPSLSSPEELRYGTNGSLSIDIEKGLWHDHEADEGGGLLDLIKRETGATNGAAFR